MEIRRLQKTFPDAQKFENVAIIVPSCTTIEAKEYDNAGDRAPHTWINFVRLVENISQFFSN